MTPTETVALLSFIGVVFNTLWNWAANRKKHEQDNDIKATASAVKSFQEANDELRVELARIREERDQARKDAANAAEQMFAITAEALNKIALSHDALTEAFREFTDASQGSRMAMREVAATMNAKQDGIASGIQAIMEQLRGLLKAVQEGETALASHLNDVRSELNRLAELAERAVS